MVRGGQGQRGHRQGASKELIEKRNELDQLIYSVEKSLGEHGDKLAEADKSAIETALETAREAKDADDLDALTKAHEALTQASHKLAEQVYAGPAVAPLSRVPEAAAPADDDDIIDAEYEES